MSLRSNTLKDANGIAVIGMAGRFPGADSVAEFWSNLVAGKSGVTSVSSTRRQTSQLPDQPNYVAKAAVVKDADRFDAGFFGIYPKQAQDMDPQHRLFLQASWQALEDAGYTPDATSKSVGVFAGCHMNTYIFLRLAADAKLRESLADCFPGGGLTTEISNDKDYLATRVAFHLNLRGPAVAVQSACSTSLVAIAQACQSLESLGCDMALAGGVTVTFPQEQGYLHTQDSILSPDGTCRTFDAHAKGTIFGDGVGAIVLKRAAEAVRDRDEIYALIKGWGVSNDGNDKGGYTAPSVDGQAQAIRMAHRKAGFAADTIGYVEAHGTGTLVGDPIEIEALTSAFRQTTDKKQFCRIGSLKSNVGHLDVAAGVAGAIKTCLCLKHQQIPASLNFDKPNPKIDFENSPFIVNRSLHEWKSDGSRRRAGVSSFGVGGTNAHVVFEEAPEPSPVPTRRTHHLIRLSARSVDALDQMTDDLADHLENNPDRQLADVCFTLQTGRKEFLHRRVAVASDHAEAIRSLRDRPGTTTWSDQCRANADVIFLFPGQGSQHFGMARDLLHSEPDFATHLHTAAEAIRPHVGLNVLDLIYGDSQDDRLDTTAYAQPAIFLVSYALAKWLFSRGLIPRMMLGHSVGEFAAAAVAEIMTLEEAALLVATRGRLMQELPTGAMLAVRMSDTKLSHLLNDLQSDNGDATVEIAAVNGPQMCVVSGPTHSIEELASKLESGHFGEHTAVTRLRTSHAFHSAMMDPAVDRFRSVLSKVRLAPPQIPIISTVTGNELSPAEATDIEYWAFQIRKPVRFSDAIGSIITSDQRVFLEVGPHQALSSLTRLHALDTELHTVLSMLPHAKQEMSAAQFAMGTLGRLWLAGVGLDWTSIYADESRNRVHLPAYRFDETRHWFRVNESSAAPPLGLTKNQPETNESDSSDESVDCPAISSQATDDIFAARLIQQQLHLLHRQVEILRQQNS